MLRSLLLTAGLLLSIPSTPLLAAPLTEQFPVSYSVSRNGFPVGVAERRLTRHGDRLVFNSTAYPTGLVSLFVSDRIVESSIMLLQGDGLVRPEQYNYQRSGGRHDNKFQLTFDWQRKEVTSSYDQRVLPLQPDTQDLLSFQLAMMLDLQQGKRSFSFPIVDKKELHIYDFKTIGTETLDTALGRVRVVKLLHEPREDEGRFVFWCAQEWGFLPARIEHKDDDGTVVLMEIRSRHDQTGGSPSSKVTD